MKEGDELYCIKSLMYDGQIFFRQNKMYKIKYLSSIRILIIEDEIIGGIEFNILDQSRNKYKFNEHFITEIELRKEKIQKLNNSIQNGTQL